jgi:cytochrome c oxidase cbb3-type subunit 3
MPGAPAAATASGTSGKDIFAKNCAGCHGAKGEGRLAGAPKFADPAWQKGQDDAELIGIIRNGKGRMPVWKDKLTDKQITTVEAYIRTLGRAPKK